MVTDKTVAAKYAGMSEREIRAEIRQKTAKLAELKQNEPKTVFKRVQEKIDAFAEGVADAADLTWLVDGTLKATRPMRTKLRRLPVSVYMPPLALIFYSATSEHADSHMTMLSLLGLLFCLCLGVLIQEKMGGPMAVDNFGDAKKAAPKADDKKSQSKGGSAKKKQ